MFEEMFKRVIANTLQEIKRREEQEFNALMMEIEAFHINNAIDRALATNNKEAFLMLTGGCKQ